MPDVLQPSTTAGASRGEAGGGSRAAGSDPAARASRAGAALNPDITALSALDDAARAISSVLGIEEVLQLIVDRVRDLVDARYAALGIAGVDGRIERFITAGIDPHDRLAIGALPSGRGLLGLIIREGRSYRIPNIAEHPDSAGFPPHHPPMTSFLGVPVIAHGHSIGNLYLTDKRGAPEFSVGDQRLVELFARHAGIAIDNARLHAQAGRLAVAEERDRIGRDLHDGIIQSLYAVGLSLEDVPELMAEAPDEAVDRIDVAIESINLSIRDIRNFIYGLRPEAVDGTQVVAGLAALAEEVRHGGLVDMVAELDPAADPGLDADAGGELLNLVREGLSNAVRHGHALRISIELTATPTGSVLEIADDGIGFDPARDFGAGHHGLANMRARAAAIGGTLEVRSARGEGTRVIVELPRPTPTREDDEGQR
ncbi:MAG TPA: GAF domain-containing sensor histidine kinase [Candidatus Deferrimicrobium sp.]|nr:GAF domain-containing sensor histidine kinase [Candidatus Deferrimicrobium sp.]